MPIITCPYCHLSSNTRRIHVLHLETVHPEAHAYNVARSRGCVVVSSTANPKVPVDTPFGLNPKVEPESPQGDLSSIPWSIHCTVYFEYESKWIQAVNTMEIRPKCSNTSRWCEDNCTDESHERYMLLYCRRGVCWYPPASATAADRIRDWGCRGIVGNVYCKGHFPVLRPRNAEWLQSSFSQTSFSAGNNACGTTKFARRTIVGNIDFDDGFTAPVITNVVPLELT